MFELLSARLLSEIWTIEFGCLVLTLGWLSIRALRRAYARCEPGNRLSWLRLQGCIVGYALEERHSQQDGSGLYARRAVSKGETLLHVPPRLWISTCEPLPLALERAAASVHAATGAPPAQYILLGIAIQQHRQMISSPVRPYLETLQVPCLPLFFSPSLEKELNPYLQNTGVPS